MKSFMCILFITSVWRVRNKSYTHLQWSGKIPFSEISDCLIVRFSFKCITMSSYFHSVVRESGSCLLVKMKYIKNRYGLLVCQCSKLHISALYKLTESVQSLSKFLLVKSPGLPRPGCKCIAFYWSLQRSAAQWLPLDWSRTLWWRYTTSFIHNHDFRYVDI